MVALKWAAWMVLCASAWLLAAHAIANAPVDSSAGGSVPDDAAGSTSVGLPWEGRLHDGLRLEATDGVRYLPENAASDHFYGTAELVGMLQRAARAIGERWPGSLLSVGELSARRGGWIDGHHSHRSGRDVDIAFFMRGATGDIQRFDRFLSFDRNGPTHDTPAHLRFDDARNWALVAQLLRDDEARIQYVFVARPIRARLLIEARKRKEPAEFLRVAAAVMVEPRRGHAHQNHFHVRIYCPRDDRPGCQDSEPYWPWYDGEPPEGRYAQLPTIRWRARGHASTHAQP